jgi:hypothetical protein
MSWTVSRLITQMEDNACCLCGIFNLNLLLLYGEGKTAFRPLQEEIIRTTLADLQRIFGPKSDGLVLSGVLADSPAEFHSCVNHHKPPRRHPRQRFRFKYRHQDTFTLPVVCDPGYERSRSCATIELSVRW